MTDCQDVRPKLSAFVDDELAAREQADVAAHLEGCTACAGVARDLYALRRAAASLGPIDPPPHVLERVLARVDPPGRPAARWLQVAAALVVVGLTASVVVRLDRRTPALAPAQSNAPTPVVVEAGGDEFHTVVTNYEQAISALETETKLDDRSIDPAMAATLKANLSAVDRAIDESRAAVTADPDDAPARDSLSESLRRKVTVLQAAADVISESMEHQR